jgi:hypothetical protein
MYREGMAAGSCCVVADLLARLSVAQASYEGRWSLRALLRVDAELYARLIEQRQFWHEARITGDEAEIGRQGEAMCRGWLVAVERMEGANEPEDAYALGQHGGVTVAIGAKASAEVRAMHDQRIVWLTPDQVAQMWVGLQNLATVKELWPDVEVVRVVEKYPDEPARED